MEKNKYDVVINYSWCKKCGICMEFCPKGVFEKDKDSRPIVARPDDCINCMLCEMRCPEFAIQVKIRKGLISNA